MYVRCISNRLLPPSSYGSADTYIRSSSHAILRDELMGVSDLYTHTYDPMTNNHDLFTKAAANPVSRLWPFLTCRTRLHPLTVPHPCDRGHLLLSSLLLSGHGGDAPG